MMKRLIPLLLLLWLTACGGNNHTGGQPTLTVTIEPLRYFTEAIAGDKFRVVSLVPKGSSPETYDPTPQQLVELARSQAWLRIGYIGFERVWADRLTANAPQLPVFDTSRGIRLIHDSHHAHEGHVHEEGVEPHVWNSAENALLIADNIFDALTRLDPSGRSYYQVRLDSLREVIRRTDLEVRRTLQDAPRTFAIYHPALSYFAREYGLRQLSLETDGKEPTPGRMQALVESCRKEQVRVLLVQQEFDRRHAQILASELDIPVVTIHPLSYDWEQEMLRTAQSLNPKTD